MKRLLMVGVAVVVGVAGFATGRASAPPPASESSDKLADIVQMIRDEVSFSELVLDDTTKREHLLAVAMMNETEANVRAAVYGYRYFVLGDNTSYTSPGEIIDRQAGICGHAYALFAALGAALEMTVRPVRFYASGGSTHIAAEVFYKGSWHYYDPTWGIYFKRDGQVLAMADVLALPERSQYAIRNESLFWYRLVAMKLFSLDLLTMLQLPELRVEYGDEGGNAH